MKLTKQQVKDLRVALRHAIGQLQDLTAAHTSERTGKTFRGYAKYVKEWRREIDRFQALAKVLQGDGEKGGVA